MHGLDESIYTVLVGKRNILRGKPAGRREYIVETDRNVEFENVDHIHFVQW
jgi:hypothetical protein